MAAAGPMEGGAKSRKTDSPDGVASTKRRTAGPIEPLAEIAEQDFQPTEA